MSDRPGSRIDAARQRAARAKAVLGAGALAAFFAVTGFAASSHPGATASSSGADDGEDGLVEADELDQEQFGFFGSIAPSGGSVPQARTSVS